MDPRYAETVEFLRARIPVPPVVGVILGVRACRAAA